MKTLLLTAAAIVALFCSDAPQASAAGSGRAVTLGRTGVLDRIAIRRAERAALAEVAFASAAARTFVVPGRRFVPRVNVFEVPVRRFAVPRVDVFEVPVRRFAVPRVDVFEFDSRHFVPRTFSRCR